MVRIVNGVIVNEPVLPTTQPISQPTVSNDQQVQYRTPTVEVFGRQVNPMYLSIGIFIFTLIFGWKGVYHSVSLLLIPIKVC